MLPTRFWLWLSGSLLFASVPVSGQVASLVADLNSSLVSGLDSAPRDLTALGGRVVFAARGQGGDPVWPQLWASDGTADGTVRLTDAPYATGAGQIGGAKLWFSPGIGGHELWRSGGTPATTFRVSPPEFEVDATAAVELGGELYFFAYDPAGRLSLWRTDATPGGTEQLADLGGRFVPGCRYGVQPDREVISPTAADDRLFYLLQRGDCDSRTWELWVFGPEGQQARRLWSFGETPPAFLRLEALGRRLLFVSGPLDDRELWVADGNRSGTGPLTDFAPPQPVRLEAGLRTVGERLYFVADDGIHGRELWSTDGTSGGTRRISELALPDPFVTYFSTSQLAALDGWVIFPALDDTGGQSLIRTDGNPASTTRLARLVGAVPGVGALVLSIVPLGPDRAVFFADDGVHGFEPWATDGTFSGTGMLLDLCPGPCGEPNDSVAIGGKAHFAAFDPVEGWELWTTDGTAQGTRRRTALGREDALGNRFTRLQLSPVGERLFFAADDGRHGIELWVAGAAPQSTRLVTDLTPGGSTGSEPEQAVALGERLLFLACDGESEVLFATDGRAAGTVPLADLGVDCEIFRLNRTLDPRRLAVAGGVGFFSRRTLWRTDGTAGGTWQVSDLGLESGAAGIVSSLADLGGEIVFAVCPGAVDCRPELWASDGTPQGTRRLVAPAEASIHRDLTALGDTLYFFANHAVFGWEVWGSDGTPQGTRRLTDRRDPDFPLAGPPRFTAVGDRVYFVAADTVSGTSLWQTDGTPEGTHRLERAFPGAQGLDPHALAAYQGDLFLVASTDSSGSHGLWRTDGTAAGTELVSRLGDAYVAGDPVFLDGKLYLLATGEDDTSLWESDGTADGTRKIAVVGPRLTSHSLGLLAAGGRLLFSGWDPEHDQEPWESDGTADGTRRLHDLAPGPEASFPAELTAAGGRVYFRADDGLLGIELWSLPTARDSNTCTPSPTALCLADRFRAEVVWDDLRGRRGIARVEPSGADAGLVFFAGHASPDGIVKVVDGQQRNGHFWAFYGDLWNAAYTLTLTDTVSGDVRRYAKLLGRIAGVGDVTAFDGGGRPQAGSAVSEVQGEALPSLAVRSRRQATEQCTPSAHRLCLVGGRFAAELRWDLADGSLAAGAGTGGDGWGTFFLHQPDNPQAAIKIVDGRGANGRFWVLAATLSRRGFDLTVTDTLTGSIAHYSHPAGQLGSIADVTAF